MPRTYAIGDIHGCNKKLTVLLSALTIQSDDTLIFLGDTIDRGADSKGVLDTIIHFTTKAIERYLDTRQPRRNDACSSPLTRISQILAKIWWYRNPAILWSNH